MVHAPPTRAWVRVEDANGDCAKWLKSNPAAVRARHRALNDDTKEVDVHGGLVPLSVEFMPGIVRFRANEANDNRPRAMIHARAFLACLHGGAQFKEGTGLWATDQRGVMPPPNFGRRLNKGRLERVLRHLVRFAWHTGRRRRGGQRR
jgi:hypothetical protein